MSQKPPIRHLTPITLGLLGLVFAISGFAFPPVLSDFLVKLGMRTTAVLFDQPLFRDLVAVALGQLAILLGSTKLTLRLGLFAMALAGINIIIVFVLLF